MHPTLERLQIAIRHGHMRIALAMVDDLIRENASREAIEATIDCALIELDGSDEPAALRRFAQRIEHGLDHDAHE